MSSFNATLRRMGACGDALKWQERLSEDTPEMAYAMCRSYDWVRWLAAILANDARELLGIACKALRVGLAEIPVDYPEVAAAMAALEGEVDGTVDLSKDELGLLEDSVKPLRERLRQEWGDTSGPTTLGVRYARLLLCMALVDTLYRWNYTKGGLVRGRTEDLEGGWGSFREERFNIADNLFITVEDVGIALARTGEPGSPNEYESHAVVLRKAVPVEAFVGKVRRYEELVASP